MQEIVRNFATDARPIERVGPYSRDESLKRVISNHGYANPGVVIGLCRIRGEAYPIKDGRTSLGCQGESPYEAFPLSRNSPIGR